MAEQSNTEQLSDQEKADLAVLQRQARILAKEQREDNEKAQNDQDWKNLGSKNAAQGRDFIRRQCGFDPGW